jgi:hypothetical protein
MVSIEEDFRIINFFSEIFPLAETPSSLIQRLYHFDTEFDNLDSDEEKLEQSFFTSLNLHELSHLMQECLLITSNSSK